MPDGERVADGAMALGGDGHDHEDGGGHAHVADGVQHVREQVVVPENVNAVLTKYNWHLIALVS